MIACTRRSSNSVSKRIALARLFTALRIPSTTSGDAPDERRTARCLWARLAKRRRADGLIDGDRPPPMLLTFTAEQWPGDNPGERYDAFRQARRDHPARHGWPGGPDAEIDSLLDQPWYDGMI